MPVNLPTLIIGLVIAVLFAAALIWGAYNRRHHKGCGGGCSGCPYSGQCHRPDKKE